MLFRRLTAGAALAAWTVIILFACLACTAPKGGIVILENPKGTGFTMEFREFNTKNKCELSLEKGDELQVEVSRNDGEIALTISGKDGSAPYTGKGLQSGTFTVTVSETDEYVIRITGKDADGRVTVKNLGSGVE